MCRIPSARNPSNSTYAYGRYIRFRLLSQQRRHHLRCRQCKGILDNLRNSFNITCRRSIIAILYLPITSMNIGFRLLSLPPEARQRFCKLDKMHFRFLLFCWISASSLLSPLRLYSSAESSTTLMSFWLFEVTSISILSSPVTPFKYGF